MKLLRRIYNALIESRQRTANAEVARVLARTEFRGESEDYVRYLIHNGKVCGEVRYV